MRSSIPMKFGNKHESDFSFSQQVGNENFFCPAHWHDCFELILVSSGEFCISIDEVGDIFLKKGDVAVLPPLTVHSTRSVSSRYEIFVFGYTREVIYTPDISVLNMKYIEPLKIGCMSRGYLIRSELCNDGRLEKLLLEAFSEYCSDEYGRELRIRSKILAIHSLICEYFISERTQDRRADDYITGAERYIADNISEDISPTDIASALHISYSHFARIVRSCLGFSAGELITRMKMNYAEELLLSNLNMDITEVAAAVGFNSASYFARQFKRQRGTSPGAYRRMLFRDCSYSSI